MVSNQERLNLIFGALADPTRRAIVSRLERGDALVGELAAPFAMSRPAISKHVAVLEGAGLVRRTRVGRESHCRLNARVLKTVDHWVSHYRQHWIERLDALASYLENEETEE